MVKCFLVIVTPEGYWGQTISRMSDPLKIAMNIALILAQLTGLETSCSHKFNFLISGYWHTPSATNSIFIILNNNNVNCKICRPKFMLFIKESWNNINETLFLLLLLCIICTYTYRNTLNKKKSFIKQPLAKSLLMRTNGELFFIKALTE